MHFDKRPGSSRTLMWDATSPNARTGLLSLVGISLALLLGGCGGSSNSNTQTFAGGPSEDPGPIHVHGLGLDPETKTLYIATHTGLW